MLEEVFRSIEKDLVDIFGSVNGAGSNGQEFVTFEDLKSFCEAYTTQIDASYPSPKLVDRKFGESPFLLHFSAAYNSFLFSRMTVLLKGQIIYNSDRYGGQRDQFFDLIVLQLSGQRRNLINVVSTTFLSGKEFQSLQMMRPLIEVSQLIFLLLTEKEKLEHFLTGELSAEEYNKLWWKSFRPATVSKRLRNNRLGIQSEYDEQGWSPLFDVRLEEPGGNQNFFDDVLQTANDCIHWRKDALLHHSFEGKKNAFRLCSTQDWSDHANRHLVNIIEVVTFSTIWIEDALLGHVDPFSDAGPNERRADQIRFIHKVYSTRCSYNGLYEFGDT